MCFLQVKNIFTSRTMAEGDVEDVQPQAGHRQLRQGKEGKELKGRRETTRYLV